MDLTIFDGPQIGMRRKSNANLSQVREADQRKENQAAHPKVWKQSQVWPEAIQRNNDVVTDLPNPSIRILKALLLNDGRSVLPLCTYQNIGLLKRLV